MDYKKAITIIKKTQACRLTEGEAWDLKAYIDSLVESRASECCVAGILREALIECKEKLNDR